MNPEKFDELIRGSDPANDQSRSDSDDLILVQSQRRWSELTVRRVVVRKRVSMCLAAMGLFAILGGSALWIGKFRRNDSRQIAVVAPIESTVDRDHSDLADAASQQQDPTSGDSQAESQSDVTERANSVARDTQPSINRSKTPRQPRRINQQGADTALQETARRDTARQLAEFVEFIEKAGAYNSETWRQSTDYLANQNAACQRAAIAMVPKLVDEVQREKAMQLVCAAAGDSKRSVLLHWLSDESTRAVAWNGLVVDGSLSQSIELLGLAQSEPERMQLCRIIAASTESRSIDVLLGLAREPEWRIAVGASARDLNPTHIQSLIMLMRERNVPLRTAAAFILASVPGKQVDQVVASMVLRGRFRQPAYLVLLSRNTPQARAFLAQAASRPDLNPALVSARMHFANIQERLQQWITESKGDKHERSDTTRQLFQETLGGYRCVSLHRTGRAIG